MVFIFCFSSQPADESNLNNYSVINFFSWLGIDLVKLLGWDFANFLIRKIAHIGEYFLLFMLAYYGFFKGKFKRPVISGFVLSVLYSCTDEIHQLFVPGRACKPEDILIDFIGMAIGSIIILINRVFSRRSTIRN